MTPSHTERAVSEGRGLSLTHPHRLPILAAPLVAACLGCPPASPSPGYQCPHASQPHAQAGDAAPGGGSGHASVGSACFPVEAIANGATSRKG